MYKSSYYEKNREKILASQKKWREANPELVKEIQRNWKEANEGRTYLCTTGYVRYIGYKHPATNPSGITGYHRIVLWDKLGGKDANCHWCDKPVYWKKKAPQNTDALVTDHLNTNKADNRPENLVPSCQSCNLKREGGQRRIPSPNAGRKCEAIYGCDRPGASHSKYQKHLWVCIPHYMQDSMHQEFKPLRRYTKRGGVSETEKECTGCKVWLPHSDFYIRNGKPKGVCKKCEVKRVQAAKKRRESMGIECAEEGCTNPAQTKGKCATHYTREWFLSRQNKMTEGKSPEEINGEDVA